MLNHFDIELIRVRTLSPSTRDFRFVRADGMPVLFEPGQFFRFTFADEAGDFERSYSLCNFEPDTESQCLDLVISTVDNGRASRLLFNSTPGLKATVSGPFGRLVVPTLLPKRLFLVATSVGIAPYMPMLAVLESALAANEVEVHFLYGTRDTTEFVYGNALNEFADRHANFHLHVCFSRCEPVSKNQIQGYVQDRLFKLSPDPETDHCLLCGNPRMIDDIYPRLKSVGFGVKRVVREKYVFAKDKAVGSAPVNTATMTDEQKRLLAEKMKKYQR
ncbi:MAG: ferredoxin-NADP reductase [Candidatus Azotimanducaceae bacterium]|jgi:ferredoxin-NADP reductase